MNEYIRDRQIAKMIVVPLVQPTQTCTTKPDLVVSLEHGRRAFKLGRD